MRTPNLARTPLLNVRPLLVTVTSLTVLSLAATTASLVDYLRTRREEQISTERLAPLQGRRDELAKEVRRLDSELSAVAWGSLDVETAALGRVLLNRQLAWTKLLGNLERVMPWDVRLLRIAPSVNDEGSVTISLSGVSTGRQGWLTLLARLFTDEVFSEPVPMFEEAPGATNAVGYRFQVRARYWPEGKS